MSEQMWNAVDSYFNAQLIPADAALENALQASDDAGLPQINVAPNQGKLLYLLARMMKARNVLEVGTLAGYSTIWLARGVADGGRVTTLEIDPKHADVARQNIASAGLSDVVDVRLGSAHDTLAALVADGAGPFDLVFIDADKASTPAYLDYAMQLTQAGSVIIIDNVVRGGRVADAANTDVHVNGIQKAIAAIGSDPRLDALALQTVGDKGWDGLAIALRVG